MKNLYLLPTDKPSRLGYLTKKGKEVYKDLRFFNRLMPIILDGENQNLYIISDEEIKDGEYAISLNLVRKGHNSDYAVFKMNLEQRQAMEELNIKKDEVLKVLLTTDQDLIKNGVQAIDDDFLKWFVNNSSCEEVKIFRLWESLFNFEYEIIFPKEPTILDSQYVDFSNTNADKISYTSTIKEEPKQEKMYSEEEVKNIIEKTLIEYSDYVLADIPEWFEQFSKLKNG